MKWRFRKQFTIIPKLLSWTASKKGASLNLKLGPMTKTWGTRGRNTTIDAPGRFGFFWRKQEPRRSKLDADERALLARQAAERRWLFLAVTVVAVEAAVGALRVFANPFSDCAPADHALMVFAILVAAQVGVIAILRSLGVKRLGLFVLTLAGVYLQWKLFGSLAIDCPAPPAPEPAPVAAD